MFARFALAILILGIATGGCQYLDVGEPVCQVCLRPMHRATHYAVYLRGEIKVDVCCPRCGLYFQQGRDDIIRAVAADFETGELISASEATFVENSSVHLCCSQEFVQKDRSGGKYVLSWDRCLPSLVAFQDQQAASAFTLRKGGVIKSYDQLVNDNR